MNWIEEARKMPIEEVRESYITEIEEITGCYDITYRLREIIQEIIDIAKPRRKRNYVWTPEVLEYLKNVMLTSPSLTDTAQQMEKYLNRRVNRQMISTIANKKANRFLRPNMNKIGAGRKAKI
jgi:hypothetical protein